MKRVLYIVSNLRNSGSTNQLYNLVKNIDKENLEIYILTISPEGENSRFTDFKKYAEIVTLNTPNYKIFFSIKKLINTVKYLSPDIIHTHTLKADILGAYFLGKRYKVCTTIHSNSMEFFVNSYGNLIGKPIAKIHISALRRIKYRISCSHFISNTLEKQNKFKSVVIQNGVEILNENQLYSFSKENFKIKNNINPNKKVLIYVGSLSILKNVEFLIAAFKKFNVNNKWQLILLGDGESKDLCENLANSSILVKGNVNNVNEYLRISDVLVSASKSEGLPMSIIEGLSFGIPALISDIGPHKEILGDNYFLGRIFENNNFNDFALQLNNIINNDSPSNKNLIKTFTRNNFSSEKMAIDYEKTYFNIINFSRC